MAEQQAREPKPVNERAEGLRISMAEQQARVCEQQRCNEPAVLEME